MKNGPRSLGWSLKKICKMCFRGFEKRGELRIFGEKTGVNWEKPVQKRDFQGGKTGEMRIKTKDFGELEINESDVIAFPEGVYAFENCRKFVLLNTGNEAGFLQLQSAQEEDPRFILLDPYRIIEDYSPDIPKEALRKLKAASLDELCVFVIAVIPREAEKASVNLRSPILINFKERLGMQAIAENSDYPVRFGLFKNERAES